MKPSLVIAGLFAAVMPADGTDWRPVVTDAGTLIHLVDAKTLPIGKEPQPTVRVLTVFADGLRTDFQAIEMISQFDCATNGIRKVRVVALDDQGRLIRDESPMHDAWQAVGPDTRLAGLAKVICGKRPVPTRSLVGELPIAEARALIGKAPDKGPK